jgi:tetratricopeptide (TPR) repeat protein
MNFFQCTREFFSFAALHNRLYCLREETLRDPDIAENRESPGEKIMNSVHEHKRICALSKPLALAASLLACAPLAAHESDLAYTMTIIIDAAHGGKVASGKYDRAIEKITASKSDRDPYSKQTNLCVAYTKTGELDKATRACEAALAITLDAKKPRRNYLGHAHAGRADRVYLALALSNLGVLHAATGSPEIARKSFREALELDTGLSAPKVNLARLAMEDVPSA